MAKATTPAALFTAQFASGILPYPDPTQTICHNASPTKIGLPCCGCPPHLPRPCVCPLSTTSSASSIDSDNLPVRQGKASEQAGRSLQIFRHIYRRESAIALAWPRETTTSPPSREPAVNCGRLSATSHVPPHLALRRGSAGAAGLKLRSRARWQAAAHSYMS